MGESGREYLEGSIMLSREKNKGSKNQYFIKSVIGEGSSTVCYEAIRIVEDGIVETGKLKEFYPINSGEHDFHYYSLKRLSDGQLVSEMEMTPIFNRMCEDYLKSYKMLRKVVVDNSQNEILKSYIQYGEILYGCTEHDSENIANYNLQPTVYIWSPGISGQGFDEYLSIVRENADKESEEKLKNILCVVDVLTDCIKALHTAGLMHLDIKPANFLVQYDSDFKIKPANISLFDIDTLCSIYSEFFRGVGTEGYCAPEVLKGRPDNRSDIYSLGAMLFNALVITKDIPDGLYRNSYYSQISQLIKNSELFRMSEINSDVILMSGICKILEKCLNMNPRRRYQSCSELKKDLEEMRKYLDKLLWDVAEKSKNGLTDATVNIQKMLYKHPLYEVITENTTDINVLIVGSGTYAQKFIDICLQIGQMSDAELKITVISESPEEDKDTYLYFRPAISEFVNIDGSLKEELAYATLEFKEKLDISNIENKKYHYVFIALEEDDKNVSVARRCSDRIYDQWRYRCPVCYLSYKIVKENRIDIVDKIYPICINEPIDVMMIDHELGEIAFNTHISWNDTMNIDMDHERKKFFEGRSYKEIYNRNSSIAFALSIKYKLHSIGIDCENFIDAAEQFSKNVLEACFSDESAKKKYNCLVDLEHRRWLIEKATEGWTAPKDGNGKLRLKDCIARGSVKDTMNRTHPCMVRGSERTPLNDIAYSENNYAKWDQGEINPNLDELDKMSIELHRCFKSYVEKIKKEDFFQDKDVVYIQNNIPNDCINVQKAFIQLQFALENIMNGNKKYSREYSNYLNRFKKVLMEVPEETRIKIENHLKMIEHNFFPIIESNLYRNYKSYDEILINNIPFILSYRYTSTIAILFEDGINYNSLNFSNVASATVLNPEKIKFLYYFDEKSNIVLLIERFGFVLNYLNVRNLHCGIELVICIPNELARFKYNELEKQWIVFKNDYNALNESAWLENITIYKVESQQAATIQFANHLQKHPVDVVDVGNQLFLSEYENNKWMETIKELEIPYFEFDWMNKKFFNCCGCQYLKFVQDKSFLRVQDMFALVGVTEAQFNLPEYADDYKVLMDIYIGNHKERKIAMQNWQDLCAVLQEYDRKKKPLVQIILQDSENPVYKKIVYFLPEYSFMVMKKIIRKLIEYEVLTEQSNIINYTSDTCKLELEVQEEYVEQIKKLFEKPQILLEYYQFKIDKRNKNHMEYVEITYNSLNVEEVDLGRSNYRESEFRILKQLENTNFITNLEERQKDSSCYVRFHYSSPRIKKILTRPEELLKIYTYYDILKTGYFDDVVCGYKYRQQADIIKKEIDLILTKEFRSMVVQCKSIRESKETDGQIQEFIEQFGGEIIIIDDITDIGQALIEVMENKN